MNKNLIWVYLISLVLVSCKVWNAMFDDTLKNKAYTVAEVLDDHYSHSECNHSRTDAIYEFYVNGKTYKTYGPTWKGLVQGEKFRIAYDSLSPSDNAKVLVEEPLFLSFEKTVKTVGTIKGDAGELGCEFFYSDEFKIEHRRLQYYYKGTLEKYPTLKKGAKFEVEYYFLNPKRAIIYFDRPVLN